MSNQVAVLGLGRMGAAMASRLTDQGWSVTGWTRSSGTDPAEAVEGTHYVLLALFDGPACAAVIDRIAPALTATTIVVNTSTVDPDEAVELARLVEKQGSRYVHAPVLGSVPAVLGGTLLVLAGGEATTEAADLLAALGEVRDAGTVADAAALKLVAAGALGQGLLAVRNSRQHGRDLGLDEAGVLDLLERTPLGTLVQRLRPRLEADVPAPADFAAGALAKDLDLLAQHSAAVVPLGAADPEADVAALAEPTDADPGVLEPLHAYIAGHATGDATHFRQAFLPTAHVEGLRDGTFVSWTLDDYVELFDGHPAPDEAGRRRRITSVEVDGTVATATMTLWHGEAVFTDAFVLLRGEDGWRIANKVYRRA